MTAIAPRNSFRRAFACWPSRIGAIALIALGVSLGSEAIATAGAAPPPSTVVAVSP